MLTRDKVFSVAVRFQRKYLCFAQESGDLRAGGIPYRRLLENGKTIHELLIVFRSKGSNFFCIPGPLHPAGFDPFVKQKKSIAIPYKAFKPVLFPAAEQEKNIFLERIQAKLLLYDRGKAIDSSSEIGPSALC